METGNKEIIDLVSDDEEDEEIVPRQYGTPVVPRHVPGPMEELIARTGYLYNQEPVPPRVYKRDMMGIEYKKVRDAYYARIYANEVRRHRARKVGVAEYVLDNKVRHDTLGLAQLIGSYL